MATDEEKATLKCKKTKKDERRRVATTIRDWTMRWLKQEAFRNTTKMKSLQNTNPSVNTLAGLEKKVRDIFNVELGKKMSDFRQRKGSQDESSSSSSACSGSGVK